MGKVVKEIIIDVALYYYGGPILGKLASGLGASVQTASALTTAVQVLAIQRGLSTLVTALGPQPGRTIDQGQQIEYSGTVEPRRIVYGQARMSGCAPALLADVLAAS